jgi:hypothetical protein
VLLVCAGLAAGQVSGMHAHLDTQGFSGPLRAAHVHSPFASHLDVVERTWHSGHANASGHDDHEVARSDTAAHHEHHEHHAQYPSGNDEPAHSGERDVIVTKTTVVALKIALAFAISFVILSLACLSTRAVPLPVVTPSLRRARLRWRPPLRAPPFALAR